MNGQDGATALLRAAEIGADGETLLALLDHRASPNVATEVLLIASISNPGLFMSPSSISVPFVHGAVNFCIRGFDSPAAI